MIIVPTSIETWLSLNNYPLGAVPSSHAPTPINNRPWNIVIVPRIPKRISLEKRIVAPKSTSSEIDIEIQINPGLISPPASLRYDLLSIKKNYQAKEKNKNKCFFHRLRFFENTCFMKFCQ